VTRTIKAALAGAGAFLTKGLVGILFPGGILIVWTFATRRLRALSSLLVAPAPLVFLAAAVLASMRWPEDYTLFLLGALTFSLSVFGGLAVIRAWGVAFSCAFFWERLIWFSLRHWK